MCWDWESPRLYQPAGMCRQLPARHSWILLWPPSARAGTSQAGRYNSARSAGLHNHHAQARPGAAEPHWAPGPGQPDSESGAGPGRPRAARRTAALGLARRQGATGMLPQCSSASDHDSAPSPSSESIWNLWLCYITPGPTVTRGRYHRTALRHPPLADM